jgi:TonB family protein
VPPGIDLDHPAEIVVAQPGESGSRAGAGWITGGGPTIAEFIRLDHSAASADRAPAPLGAVEPDYPAPLREAGVEGSATVEFVVDSVGVPQSAESRVIQADRPEFGDAALAAALASRFATGTSAGRPVPVRVRQVVRFRLK